MNKAIFLDRDGTVNVEKAYLFRPEDFEFEKNVPAALKELYEMGYLLIIVSNQSGIARGYFGVREVEKLHRFVQSKAIKLGFEFKAFYFCPHHPEGTVPAYSTVCKCRKPETEMIDEAVKAFDIDLSASFMIGDKESDLQLGRRTGMTTVLVGSGYGEKTKNEKVDYDYFISDFGSLPELVTNLA